MSNTSCKEFHLCGPESTEEFASRLSALLEAGQFLAMCGDLGAGKTTFTRSLTESLGCSVLATSPTFALFQRYPEGRFPVFHADLYRIGSEDELFELGWDEVLEEYKEGLMVVEWADKFPDSWPQDHLRLDCRYGANDDSRVFQVTARGERSERLLSRLERETSHE